MTGDGTNGVDDRPWRKRRPVLSRSILYVLGLGLAALLVVLYANRKEEDEAASADALRKELNDLSLVMALDPDGTQVLRILDDKFARKDLPADMQGRALRWRALAHRRGKRHAEAGAALAAAAALELPERERLALQIEWAEALAEAGDVTRAMEKLPSQAVVIDGPLGMLRDLLYAQLRAREGTETVARKHLVSVLARLPAPLPEHLEDYVGGRPWTPSQVATVLTELLATLAGNEASTVTAAWRDLERLAPRDFEAQAAATRGFMALGLEQDARRAWARAAVLDPKQAAALARSDPVLVRLKDGAD